MNFLKLLTDPIDRALACTATIRQGAMYMQYASKAKRMRVPAAKIEQTISADLWASSSLRCEMYMKNWKGGGHAGQAK